MKEEENDIPSGKPEQKPEKVLGFFDTKKEPRKSLANFQRNQYRLLSTSLAMADRKAMIMIRLNAVLVSAMIVFKEFVEINVTNGAIIILILTLGGGLSLILSLVAASPSKSIMRYLGKKHMMKDYPDWKYHCMFLFQTCSLLEYEKAMKEVVNSQDLQIGNQTRIFYVFSRYLLLKYGILDFAFYSFFFSVLLSIVIFLIGHCDECLF